MPLEGEIAVNICRLMAFLPEDVDSLNWNWSWIEKKIDVETEKIIMKQKKNPKENLMIDEENVEENSIKVQDNLEIIKRKLFLMRFKVLKNKSKLNIDLIILIYVIV